MTEHTARTSPRIRAPKRHPRPWTLWAIALIIALIGAANLALAWDQLRHADRYADLGVSYPIWLRTITALAWGALLVAFGAGLARRQQWARRWVVLLVSNYGLFGVLWLVSYAESDFGRDRIAFQAALTGLLVLLLAWVMRWRRVRRPFDPTPPDPINARDAGDEPYDS